MSISHFKDGKIKEEPGDLPENRVVKYETKVDPVVEQFQFGQLHKAGDGNYAATKAKYGALAATDTDRAAKSQRDRRFSLNPLLRDPLSVEQEEKRVIDEMVRMRIEAVTAEAKARGHEQGREEGLTQGHKDAFEKFKTEATERMSQLEKLIVELEGTRQEIFRANEHFLIELIFKIGRMVTLRELSADREYLVRLARELVERTGVRDGIKIRISPKDAESINMLREGMAKTLGTLKNLQIEASPQISDGGCSVETEFSAFDGSLEAQFKGIEEALLGAKKTEGSSA